MSTQDRTQLEKYEVLINLFVEGRVTGREFEVPSSPCSRATRLDGPTRCSACCNRSSVPSMITTRMSPTRRSSGTTRMNCGRISAKPSGV